MMRIVEQRQKEMLDGLVSLRQQRRETAMFEIATLTANNTVQLPLEIARRFVPADRFIVWLEGDTLYLKRLISSPLKRVGDAPEDEPISLDEINEIVHEVRQRRHVSKAK